MLMMITTKMRRIIVNPGLSLIQSKTFFINPQNFDQKPLKKALTAKNAIAPATSKPTSNPLQNPISPQYGISFV